MISVGTYWLLGIPLAAAIPFVQHGLALALPEAVMARGRDRGLLDQQLSTRCDLRGAKLERSVRGSMSEETFAQPRVVANLVDEQARELGIELRARVAGEFL